MLVRCSPPSSTSMIHSEWRRGASVDEDSMRFCRVPFLAVPQAKAAVPFLAVPQAKAALSTDLVVDRGRLGRAVPGGLTRRGDTVSLLQRSPVKQY
eukprot:SAG22_NODE_1555_length_4133_cov_3.586515_5_plen_96_part_00